LNDLYIEKITTIIIFIKKEEAEVVLRMKK